MRILLLYPRFPKTYWSMHGVLKLLGRKVLLPPLGLITVAALLPRSWELRLVDCNVREVSDEDWHWADLVIASAMIVQKQDLARLIREACAHQLPVAVGGPYASSTPDAPELQQAQYLILDEGELTIPLFVEALARSEKQGRFSAKGERPDVSLSPIPRFDLLEMNAYNMMAVQFSRGCPFQCEFCDIIVLYGRKPRTKSPAQLLRELDQLQALGWHGEIFLVDDNFIGNKRNVKLLLPELRRWQQRHGYPFRFTTEASLNLSSDPELMRAMVSCGFRRVFLGIETPDQSSLRVTNKLQNTRSPLEESVAAITDHGLHAMAGFILGFDGEQPGAGQRIVEFVNHTAIPLAMLGILVALPNTALWHRLAREGRLLDGDDRFDQGVQTHLLNFVPDRSIEEIAAEFLQAFSDLYHPISYAKRVHRYVCKLAEGRRRHGEDSPTPLAWTRSTGLLKGVLILIWRQGIKRSSRSVFWQQLADILINNRLILDEYIWLLMLNEHFLDYQQTVRRQVEEQLASMRTPTPLRPACLPVASGQ
jgi:Fe-S oxidoreductase